MVIGAVPDAATAAHDADEEFDLGERTPASGALVGPDFLPPAARMTKAADDVFGPPVRAFAHTFEYGGRLEVCHQRRNGVWGAISLNGRRSRSASWPG